MTPSSTSTKVIQWFGIIRGRYLLQDANLFEINLMDFLPGSRNLLSTIQKVYQHFACIGCCWKIIFNISVIYKAFICFNDVIIIVKIKINLESLKEQGSIDLIISTGNKLYLRSFPCLPLQSVHTRARSIMTL